jgi:hypothetical protein
MALSGQESREEKGYLRRELLTEKITGHRNSYDVVAVLYQ